LGFFEQLYHERFAKPAYRDLYQVAGDPIEALDDIEAWSATDLPSKWYE
jgi:hypothetical protein